MTRGIMNDLTGQVFGHLKVIERTTGDGHGNAQWLCKCDCGSEATVRGSFLRKGQKYCSKRCKLFSDSLFKDIVNQRFGKLLAVSFIEFGNGGKAVWKFQCDCGNSLNATSDRVLNSNMKCCGKGKCHGAYTNGESHTRGYKAMHWMKYSYAKKQRVPKWVDQHQIDKMIAIYDNASRLSRESGIPHEVDHYYPLQGKNVSGLHVPENLRIVTRNINRTKSNSTPDDIC